MELRKIGWSDNRAEWRNGIRNGLKIRGSKGREGSSPSSATNKKATHDRVAFLFLHTCTNEIVRESLSLGVIFFFCVAIILLVL